MKRTLLVHPFLFALYQVIFVFSGNTSYLPVEALLLPALVSLLAAAVLMILLRMILLAGDRAAAGTSVIVLLLSGVRPLYEILLRYQWPNFAERGELYLLFVASMVIVFAMVLLRGLRSLPVSVTGALNVIALSAVLLGAAPAVAGLVAASPAVRPMSIERAESGLRAGRPSVYYVILDSYTGSEILQKYYHHDNRPFLDSLEQLGFFVARNARTNYVQSMLSLGSSLNVSYLDELLTRPDTSSSNRKPLMRLQEENAVRSFLSGLGYRFVAFGTGYEGTELRSADEYLEPRIAFTEYENSLFAWTPIAVLVGVVDPDWQHRIHRNRLRFIFDELEQLALRDEPLFVFAHIVAPHPPYVFGREGEEKRDPGPFTMEDGSVFIDRSSLVQYRRGFSEQIAFVERRTLEMVRAILRNSAQPPVIILQADHGPRSIPDHDEVLRILSAFWLPAGREGLYDSISPVNNFRVVLNCAFGAHLPLLPDRHFLSTWEHPYAFEEVGGRAGEAAAPKPRSRGKP